MGLAPSERRLIYDRCSAMWLQVLDANSIPKRTRFPARAGASTTYPISTLIYTAERRVIISSG